MRCISRKSPISSWVLLMRRSIILLLPSLPSDENETAIVPRSTNILSSKSTLRVKPILPQPTTTDAPPATAASSFARGAYHGTRLALSGRHLRHASPVICFIYGEEYTHAGVYPCTDVILQSARQARESASPPPRH